jgi:hypothetical protein
VLLEEQRDVAHHEPVATLARLVQEALTKALDFGVNDVVQLLQLIGVAEYGAAQRRTIELLVRADDGRAPTPDNLVVSRRALSHGASRQHVGIDDRRAPLGQQLRDSGFAAPNVACQSYDQHLIAPPRHTLAAPARAPR